MPGSRAKEISCLLDTDIVIDFLRGRVYALKLLEDWSGKGLLAISTLTHLEIFQGMRSGEAEATGAFLDGLTSVSVDVSIARRAGKILGELRSKGISVGMTDSVIAATALQFGVPLLTNNVQHYPVSGLNVVQGLAI